MDFLVGIHSKDVDSNRLYVDGFKVLSLPELTFYDIWFDFKNMDIGHRLGYISDLQFVARGFIFANLLSLEDRLYLGDINRECIEIEEDRLILHNTRNHPEFDYYIPIFSNDKLGIDTSNESVASRLMQINLFNVGDSNIKDDTITYSIKNCIDSHSLYSMGIVIDLKSLSCGITIDKEYVYGDKSTVDLLGGYDKHGYDERYSRYYFLVGGDKRVCPFKLNDLLPVEYSNGRLLLVGNTAVITLETDDLNDNIIIQNNITDVIVRFDGGNIKYKPINVVFPPSVSNLTFIQSPNIHKTNDFVTFILPRTDNLPNILREIYENEISKSIYGSKLNKNSVLNSILSTLGVDYRGSYNVLENDLDKFIKIMKVLRIKVEFYG